MTDETTNPGIPEPEGRSDIIDTDYEVGQDNYETTIAGVKLDIHNPVFMISAGLILLFVAIALLFPTESKDVFLTVRNYIKSTFD